jgi:hypothetical protein
LFAVRVAPLRLEEELNLVILKKGATSQKSAVERKVFFDEQV